jgi:hypothetical protein
VLERKAAEFAIALGVKPSLHALFCCLQHIHMYIWGLVFQCKVVLMYSVVGMGFFPQVLQGMLSPMSSVCHRLAHCVLRLKLVEAYSVFANHQE